MRGTANPERLPLSGRTILVTGASSGVGRALAVGLAARGASLLLVARRRAALELLAREISDLGAAATVITADVASDDSIQLIRHATDGVEVDVLVNAAGVFGPIAEMTATAIGDWSETFNVNVVGAVRMIQAVVPGMRARCRGTVVNVSSAAAFVAPRGGTSAYAASKVALNTLTRHLAAELEGSGVTANAIHPGDIRTEMFDGIRQAAHAAGPEGAPYRDWVRWMDDTGGDAPDKVVDLVAELALLREDGPSGRFLWIDEGLTPPAPTW